MEDKTKPKPTYRRGMHPNSMKTVLENRIKKGTVLNPIGAHAHDPVKKALKRFTNEYMKEIVELAVMGNLAALKEVAENPNTPAIQVGVAKALAHAINDGDWTTLRAIVSEILGKQADKIDLTVTPKPMEETEEEKEKRQQRVQEKLNKLKLLNVGA